MRNRAGTYILSEFSEIDLERQLLPKFSEGTVPAFHENDYLLQKIGADYWALSEYYLPQSTNCGCSAASAAMALNALRSRLAPYEPLLSERSVVSAVNDPEWIARTAENGGGVTMARLEKVLRVGLDRLDLGGAVQAFSPRPRR